jgi:lysozyme
MSRRARIGVGALVVSASALVSIALYEGYRGEAYTPVEGDVPTLGFGQTAGVRPVDRTTPARALVVLLADADRHAQAVRRCAPVPMYQHEFDAYVSLAYNIGEGAFCSSSIPRKLAAGDYEAACATIREFVCGPATAATADARCTRPGGPPKRVLPGLVNRREKEYRTCMGATDGVPDAWP